MVGNTVGLCTGINRYGIEVFGDGRRIEGNNCTSGAGYGIYVYGRSFLTRNTARGNAGGNYSVGGGLTRGNVFIYPSGGVTVISEPWANFEY